MIKNEININNINISYICEGVGEDIIFLHGWGQKVEAFGPIIELLKEDYRVWAIDFPGHGESSEPLEGLDIYENEDIVEKFIEKMQINKPTIVGHSFGGRVGIIYAAKNENINKLVLTGAAGIIPKRDFIYKYKVYHYKFMKLLTKTPLYSQYRDDLLNTSGSTDYKNASLVMKDTLIKVVNEDLQYLMPDIKCETLLYWGSVDEATPLSDGQTMNKLIEKSTLKVMKNSTHFAYLENYQDFVAEIVKFLDKE